MDRQRQRATLDGETLDVTPTEFRMLWALIENPGFVLTRDELMEAGRGQEVGTHGRTIDAHIRSIRKKLGKRSDLVETVRGYGYRLSESLSGAQDFESPTISSMRSWPA